MARSENHTNEAFGDYGIRLLKGHFLVTEINFCSTPKTLKIQDIFQLVETVHTTKKLRNEVLKTYKVDNFKVATPWAYKFARVPSQLSRVISSYKYFCRKS